MVVVAVVGADWAAEGRPTPRVWVEAAAPRARVADPRWRGGVRLAAAVAAAKAEAKVGAMRGPPPCSTACTNHKESVAIIH